MKNIEKYEEELKKGITKFKRIPCIAKELKDGCSVICRNRNCVTCSLEMLHWLSQEYKEPLLTEKEKTYLKNVIEFQRSEITNIIKIHCYTKKLNEFFTINIYARSPYENGYIYKLLEFIVTEDMPFKNMEVLKFYTLEELGL